MSFFNRHRRLAPIAILFGASDLTGAVTGANNFRATCAGGSTLFAAPSVAQSSTAVLTGGSALEAAGRIGIEPNVFGAVILVGESNFAPQARIRREAVAVLRGESNCTARAQSATAERSVLNLFLTIAPEYVASLHRVYSARVIADGANIPIKNFSYNESAATAGIDAGFTLARFGDRAAVEAADEFDFDIYDGAAWRVLFAGGRRTQNATQSAFSDSRPNDSATFGTSAPIAEKLEKAPVSNLTIYDPARQSLKQADFERVFDTTGAAYIQQLRRESNLTIYRLMQIVFVELCGFAGYKTNLPNWNVRRCDFQMSESYLDGFSGHIGMFNPLFFVQNDFVWILDATGSLPSGFAAPTVIDSSRYKSAQFSQINEEIDGYIVNYSQDDAGYDFSIDIPETDDVETSGASPFASDYTETRRFRVERHFFKNSQPGASVRTETLTEKVRVSARVNNALTLINEETERYFYDAFNNLLRIEKEIFGLVPNLANPEFLPIWTRLRFVKSKFYYRPDILSSRRQILYRTEVEESGLIGIDTENQALGQVFRQDFSDANRAGNLTGGMTTEFGAIKTVTETLKQSRNGQMKFKIKTTDFLTVPPTVNNSTTDARSGDASLNAVTTAQKQIVALAPGAIRQNAKLKTISVAELPLIYAVPLVRRRLANRTKRQGTITLVGFDLSLRRGSLINLKDRDDQFIGSFIIEGFSIQGQNLGTRAQTTEQILEVREIAPVV